MEELNELSISFSSVLKDLQLCHATKRASDLSEAEFLLHRLSRIDLLQLKTDAEKKAFWINVYNGLTNYILVKKNIKRTIIFNFHSFSLFKITVGDYQWSLNHIEHGILRKNSTPLLRLRKPFTNDDPRRKHMLKVKDNRIHFALNCGGISCPQIRMYHSHTIDQDLDIATQEFLHENIKIDDENKIIRCSPLFKWYRRDFEGKYVYDKKYKDYILKFSQYDWSLNLRPS